MKRRPSASIFQTAPDFWLSMGVKIPGAAEEWFTVLKRSSEEWSTPPRFEVWRRSVANLHVEHHKRQTTKDFCLGSSEGLAFSFSMTPIQPLYFYRLIYDSLRFFRLYFTDDIFNLPQKCKHSKGVLQTHCLEQLSNGKFSGKFSRSPV